MIASPSIASTALTQPGASSAQDSGAAYVTRPGGPPDNSGYRNAAYGIALAIYAAYLIVLVRRNAAMRRSSGGA